MAVMNFLLLIQWQLYILSSTYAIYSHHIAAVIVSIMVHVMFVAFMDMLMTRQHVLHLGYMIIQI